MREDTTTDVVDTKREYYEQPCANIFVNLDETGKLFERNNLPKITQEETDNLKSSVLVCSGCHNKIP